MAGIPAKIHNRGAGRDGDGDIGTVFTETFGTQFGMGYFIMDAVVAG